MLDQSQLMDPIIRTVRRPLVTALLFIWMLSPPLLLAGPDFAIPKPTDALLPPPPPPALEPSVVHLTVGRHLGDMIEAVDAAIPVHHRHEEEWIPGKQPLDGAPFDYQYYLWRGPVRFSVDGERLVTDFPDVRYRVRVRLQETNGAARIAECGYGPDAHMRMNVQAASDLQWSPDWKLQIGTHFGSPRFVTPCRLDPIALDITGMVNGWFAERLPALASSIDRVFSAQTEAKQRAQLIWNALQEPMELRPGTWLTFRPQNPRAGSTILNPDRSVHTVVSMAFDPIIAVGNKPHPDRTPLPPLQTAPAAKEGFHLAVPMLVPYETVNEKLAKEVVGQEIVPPVGSAVRINGIRVYGSSTNLVSEVALSGGVNGLLYLQGIPAIAPDGHTLEFHNFDFTIETSNMLAKFANRMLYETIREKVVESSRIEVGDRIEALRRQVERQMNRQLAKDIWLQGSVTTLAPRGVYPVPDGIELQFAMDGALRVIIQ